MPPRSIRTEKSVERPVQANPDGASAKGCTYPIVRRSATPVSGYVRTTTESNRPRQRLLPMPPIRTRRFDEKANEYPVRVAVGTSPGSTGIVSNSEPRIVRSVRHLRPIIDPRRESDGSSDNVRAQATEPRATARETALVPGWAVSRPTTSLWGSTSKCARARYSGRRPVRVASIRYSTPPTEVAGPS